MKKKNSGKELLQKLGTLMALALLVLIFCVMMPDKFPRISNIMNIFKQASINCLIASGMLCALITAGIDLSVGSNCVLCTCTIGVLVQNFGITSMPLLIIAGLAVSTFAGVGKGNGFRPCNHQGQAPQHVLHAQGGHEGMGQVQTGRNPLPLPTPAWTT